MTLQRKRKKEKETHLFFFSVIPLRVCTFVCVSCRCVCRRVCARRAWCLGLPTIGDLSRWDSVGKPQLIADLLKQRRDSDAAGTSAAESVVLPGVSLEGNVLQVSKWPVLVLQKRCRFHVRGTLPTISVTFNHFSFQARFA